MFAIENFISYEVIQKIGWVLLHFIWQAAAVALVLAFVLRVMRRFSANIRYIAACFALMVVVVLPFVTMQFIKVDTHPAPIKTETTLATIDFEPAIVPSEITFGTSEAEPAKVVNVEPEPVITERNTNWKEQIVTFFEPKLSLIVTIWLLGVFTLAIWHLGGYAQLQKLRKKMVKQVDSSLNDKLKVLSQKIGVTQTVELLESALVQIPTVVGWLKPVILLPASALTGLTTEQLEAILAHELAHIKRYDYLVNILQTIVEILGFYHPAVWWISHIIRHERENCCDDIAVSICGDKIHYAKALASMEEIRGRNQLAVAATGGNLFSRICRLVGKDSSEKNSLSWITALTVILLLIALAIPTTIAFTSSRNEDPNNAQIEKMLMDGFRENRDKFKCGILAWNRKTLDDGFISETEKYETKGSFQLWWDGDKIATRYTKEQYYTGEGDSGIKEIIGGNVYDGKPLSRKPQFNDYENWLEQVIRWTGPLPLDKDIAEMKKLNNISLDWEITDSDQGKQIKLTGNNLVVGSSGIQYFDISKGYNLIRRESYNPQGQLYSLETRKLQKIGDGWFPVEVEMKSFDTTDGKVELNHHFVLDMSRCSFNEPDALPKGIFDFSTVKEHEQLNKIIEKYTKNATAYDDNMKNACDSVSNYIAAVMSNQDEDAVKYAYPDSSIAQSDDNDQTREILKGQQLQLIAVYADDWNALVTTSVILADHGQIGPMVFQLKRIFLEQKEYWLIEDIDIETIDSIEEEYDRFLEENSDAKTLKLKEPISINTISVQNQIISAEFILGKMLEHRSQVRNLQYVVKELTIPNDNPDNLTLKQLEDNLKRMKEEGDSEVNIRFTENAIEQIKVQQNYSDRNIHKIIKCTIDNEGRSKTESITGSYDSSGNFAPNGSTFIRSNTSEQSVTLYKLMNDSYRATIYKGGSTSDDPWSVFVNYFCQCLQHSISTTKNIDIENLDDGTYRMSFDYQINDYPVRKIIADIDPSKGYTCSSYENHYDGKLSSRITAEYEEIADSLWFPIGTEMETFTSEYLDRRISRESSQIKINGPTIDASFFEVEMPNGTIVEDYSKNTEQPERYTYNKPDKSEETNDFFPQAYEFHDSQTISIGDTKALLELHKKKEGFGEIPEFVVVIKSSDQELRLNIKSAFFEPMFQTNTWYKVINTKPFTLCIANPSGGNAWNARPWYVICSESNGTLKNIGQISAIRDVDKDGIEDLVKYEDVWENGLGWFSHADSPGAEIYYKIENDELVPDVSKNMKIWNDEINEFNQQITTLSHEISRNTTTEIVQLNQGFFKDKLLHAILEKFLRYGLLEKPEQGWEQLRKDLSYLDNEYFFFAVTDPKNDNLKAITGKFPIKEIEEIIKDSLVRAGYEKWLVTENNELRDSSKLHAGSIISENIEVQPLITENSNSGTKILIEAQVIHANKDFLLQAGLDTNSNNQKTLTLDSINKKALLSIADESRNASFASHIFMMTSSGQEATIKSGTGYKFKSQELGRFLKLKPEVSQDGRNVNVNCEIITRQLENFNLFEDVYLNNKIDINDISESQVTEQKTNIGKNLLTSDQTLVILGGTLVSLQDVENGTPVFNFIPYMGDVISPSSSINLDNNEIILIKATIVHDEHINENGDVAPNNLSDDVFTSRVFRVKFNLNSLEPGQYLEINNKDKREIMMVQVNCQSGRAFPCYDGHADFDIKSNFDFDLATKLYIKNSTLKQSSWDASFDNPKIIGNGKFSTKTLTIGAWDVNIYNAAPGDNLHESQISLVEVQIKPENKQAQKEQEKSDNKLETQFKNDNPELKDNFELLGIDFKPVHSGINEVYIKLKNKTDEEQIFRAEFMATSPDENGENANTRVMQNNFIVIGPLKTEIVRAVYQFDKPFNENSSLRLALYNPPKMDDKYGQYFFFFRKFDSNDLKPSTAKTIETSPANQDQVIEINRAFRRFQNLLQNQEYENAWELLTDDYKIVEFHSSMDMGLEMFNKAMKQLEYGAYASKWDKQEFLKLLPGKVTYNNETLYLAADYDDQRWTIYFKMEDGKYKINWIDGYTPVSLKTEQRNTTEEKPVAAQKQVLLEIELLEVSKQYLNDENVLKEILKNAPKNANMVPMPVIPDSWSTSFLDDSQIDLLFNDKSENIKTLARPTLLTQDNKLATISTGEEIPYITGYNEPDNPNEKATPQVSYRLVGLLCKFTPHIVPNNKDIILQTELEHNQVIGYGEQIFNDKYKEMVPMFSTKSIATSIRIEPGITLIANLGGIKSEQENTSGSDKDERELLLLIKPTIITPEQMQPVDKSDSLNEQDTIGPSRDEFIINSSENTQFVNGQEKLEEQPDQNQLPYSGLITYAENWRELINKNKQDKPLLDEKDEAVYNQLNEIIDLSHLNQSMTFEQVLEVFRKLTNPPLQIQPNWRDLSEKANITPDTLSKMGPLRDVKLRAALEVLLVGLSNKQVPISYTIREGVILIATADSLPANLYQLTYDISDLVSMPALNYMLRTTDSINSLQYGGNPYGNGMTIGGMMNRYGNPYGSGPMNDYGNDYGSGYGNMLYDTNNNHAEELKSLIMELIEPKSWYEIDKKGIGTIELYPAENPKKMTVTNTIEVHQKIEKFLNSMREALGDTSGNDQPVITYDVMVQRTYDITDLVDFFHRQSIDINIPEFNTSMNPNNMIGGYMGGGMMVGLGGSYGGMPNEEIIKASNKLIKLVMERVEPDTWYNNNEQAEGTIYPYPASSPKKLAVTNTPEVHNKIIKLFESIRNSNDMAMISIETRYIYASELAIKEILKETGIKNIDGIILDDEQVKSLIKGTQNYTNTKSLAAPKVTILNGETAQFESANIFCKITPEVSEDKKEITLDITQTNPYSEQGPDDLISLSKIKVPDGKVYVYSRAAKDPKNPSTEKMLFIVLTKPTIIQQEEEPIPGPDGFGSMMESNPAMVEGTNSYYSFNSQQNENEQMVYIETQVAEVSESFLEELGLDANSLKESNKWSKYSIDKSSEPNKFVIDELSASLLQQAIDSYKYASVDFQPNLLAQVGKPAEMKIATKIYYIPKDDYIKEISLKSEEELKTIKPQPVPFDQLEKNTFGHTFKFTPEIVKQNDIHLKAEFDIRDNISQSTELKINDKIIPTHSTLPILVTLFGETIEAIIPDGQTLLIIGNKITYSTEVKENKPLINLPLVKGLFKIDGTSTIRDEHIQLFMVKPTILSPEKAEIMKKKLYSEDKSKL